MERLCVCWRCSRGVTAVIGGGGKTSLLYRLASRAAGAGDGAGRDDDADPAAGASARPS